MTDLVRPGDLNGIALLNAGGDVVASAGSLAGFEQQVWRPEPGHALGVADGDGDESGGPGHERDP